MTNILYDQLCLWIIDFSSTLFCISWDTWGVLLSVTNLLMLFARPEKIQFFCLSLSVAACWGLIGSRFRSNILRVVDSLNYGGFPNYWVPKGSEKMLRILWNKNVYIYVVIIIILPNQYCVTCGIYNTTLYKVITGLNLNLISWTRLNNVSGIYIYYIHTYLYIYI